jgi:hypothetical protein
MKLSQVCRTFIVVAVLWALADALAAQEQAHHSTTLSPDLALVPSDVRLLACVNLTKYWDSREADSLNRIANSHPVVFTWGFKDMPSGMGLQPENVVRLTMFNTSGEGIYIVSTKQPYDGERVLAAIAPEAVQKSVAGKTYFYSAKSTKTVYLLDEHTFVCGNEQDLTGLLSRADSSERDASLDRALFASQQGAPFVVHAGANVVRDFAAEKDMRYGPFASLAHAHAWQIITTLDEQLTIDLRADFDTESDAEQSAAAFAAVGETLSGVVGLYRSHMDPFLIQEANEHPGAKDLLVELDHTFDAAAEGLKGIRTKSVKKTGGARIVINTGKPVTATVLLVSMLPRGEKKH